MLIILAFFFKISKRIIHTDDPTQDDNGHTPLHLAAEKGQLSVVQYIKYIISLVNDKNPKKRRIFI